MSLTDYQVIKVGTTYTAYDPAGMQIASGTDAGAVIRACVGADRRIVIGAGTFLLSSLAASTDCIDLGSTSHRCAIVGMGQGATVLKVNVASWRSVIRADASDDVSISNLTVDGNKASFAGNPGIGLRFLSTSSQRVHIERVEIKNTDDRAMSLSCQYVWVKDCWVHNADKGIGFNDRADSHVWVRDNLIHDIGTKWTQISDGIYFGGQYAEFSGNTIFGVTDTGLNVGGIISPTGWVRIVGNLIFNVGNSGVNTGGGDNDYIAGNTIFACGRKDAVPRSNAGIRIRDDGGGAFTSNGIVVSGNRCYEDVVGFPLDTGALGQLYGVEIVNLLGGGAPDNLVITGNDLRGNSVAIQKTNLGPDVLIHDNLIC